MEDLGLTDHDQELEDLKEVANGFSSWDSTKEMLGDPNSKNAQLAMGLAAGGPALSSSMVNGAQDKYGKFFAQFEDAVPTEVEDLKPPMLRSNPLEQFHELKQVGGDLIVGPALKLQKMVTEWNRNFEKFQRNPTREMGLALYRMKKKLDHVGGELLDTGKTAAKLFKQTAKEGTRALVRNAKGLLQNEPPVEPGNLIPKEVTENALGAYNAAAAALKVESLPTLFKMYSAGDLMAGNIYLSMMATKTRQLRREVADWARENADRTEMEDAILHKRRPLYDPNSKTERKWRKLYGNNANKLFSKDLHSDFDTRDGQKYFQYRGRGTTPLYLEQNLVEYTNVTDPKFQAKAFTDCGKTLKSGVFSTTYLHPFLVFKRPVQQVHVRLRNHYHPEQILYDADFQLKEPSKYLSETMPPIRGWFHPHLNLFRSEDNPPYTGHSALPGVVKNRRTARSMASCGGRSSAATAARRSTSNC
ncbi:unnamed protein product [Amoebophrya sp. A120]|nr:unnamed protein product [Amoebophrya sp. A120]|eukprot:GSA120T00010499001.1